MKVARRPGQFNLVVIQAAQAIGDGGNAFAEHRSVRNQQGIRFQFFFVALDEVPQADAADLFLAFNQHFDVYRKFSVKLMEGFEGFQMDMNLALVVGGAAAVDISIAHFRLEGG